MAKKIILLVALSALAGCAMESFFLEFHNAHTAGMGSAKSVEAAAE